MHQRILIFIASFLIVGAAAWAQVGLKNPGTVASLAPAPTAGGSISVDNAWKNADTATSTAVTISGTAGRFLVVGIACYTGDHANHAVTDNIDGATGWTKVTGINNSNSKGSIWYKASIPSGITTVTCTGGSGTSSTIGIVHEVSGVSTFTGGEVVSGATAGVSSYGPGNVNNATANSVLFGLFFSHNFALETWTLNDTGTTGTWSYADATNSKELDGGSYVIAASMPSIVVSTTGNKTHVWGSVNNGGYATAIIAAFH